MTSQQKFKIVLFSFPGPGHINPVSCIVRELIDKHNVQVICYGLDMIKTYIEKSGAEYRKYGKSEWTEPPNPKIGDVLNVLLDMTNENLLRLVKMIENETPDLIIYDEMAIYAKFALRFLRKKHRKSKTFTIPPAIMFRAALPIQIGVHPNKVESELMGKSLANTFSLVQPNLKLLLLNLRYGLGVNNLIEFTWMTAEKMNIVGIFPELQPRSHLFSKVNKFVGICLKEEVRSFKTDDAKLQSFIDEFEPINPLKTGIHISAKQHLIYVSLGTVFNKQEKAFVAIIEGLKSLEEQHKYKMIVACGKEILAKLETRIEKKQLLIPENMVLASFAPQIEILKRASLFITHCGMNSTSEAIHYGVPIVCLPVSADQPRVAYRVADELGLGVRLNLKKLTQASVKDAVKEIMTDSGYQERMLRFSKISRSYNGVNNAIKEIFDYVERTKASTEKRIIN